MKCTVASEATTAVTMATSTFRGPIQLTTNQLLTRLLGEVASTTSIENIFLKIYKEKIVLFVRTYYLDLFVGNKLKIVGI